MKLKVFHPVEQSLVTEFSSIQQLCTALEVSNPIQPIFSPD